MGQWKCDRGHVVQRKNAERRAHRSQDRWFNWCAICKAQKPLSRQQVKTPADGPPALSPSSRR